MDPEADQVIELGIVVFEYEPESGQVGPVVARFSGLEDPGRPIPPETIAVHHITDEMVAGLKVDDAQVAKALEGVTLVIAHNAKFDRPFVEARWPAFESLAWACSIQDVDWRSHGYASSALEFLAMRAGLFYDAHRAEMDCRVVLAVLARSLGDSGKSALHALLESARQPSYRLAALNSPFDSKDVLKQRGYRWNAEAKVWAVDIAESDQVEELAWLRTEVYEGKTAEVEIERLDAGRRYSLRSGKKERVKL
jgi:DNA polymerase-3 subunit epsilon